MFDNLKNLILLQNSAITALQQQVTQLSTSGGGPLTTTVTGAQRKTELLGKLLKRHNKLDNGNLSPDKVEALFKSEFGQNANTSSPKEERLKGEKVGWLDPEAPEQFCKTILSMQEVYGDAAVVKAIAKSMVANHDTTVTDWFATLHTASGITKLAMKTVEGWCELVRAKFGKTTLDKI